jgi:hypothetical protein
VIPKMQAVDKGGVEKKGAPIPNMQPVQGQTSTSGEQSTGASESGQSGNKRYALRSSGQIAHEGRGERLSRPLVQAFRSLCTGKIYNFMVT